MTMLRPIKTPEEHKAALARIDRAAYLPDTLVEPLDAVRLRQIGRSRPDLPAGFPPEQGRGAFELRRILAADHKVVTVAAEPPSQFQAGSPNRPRSWSERPTCRWRTPTSG